MARVPVPHAKDWKDLLEGLLGRDVSVAPGDPVIPRPGQPAMVALYTDKRLQLQAVVVVDLPLAAAIGASLGLLPAGSVAEAISDGLLTEAMHENAHEVLNVGASTFNKGDSHLALYQDFAPGQVPPVDASVLLRTLGRRLDLRVEVQGYGKGGLSVVLNAR